MLVESQPHNLSKGAGRLVLRDNCRKVSKIYFGSLPSAWKIVSFKDVKLERNADNLGVNFRYEIFGGGLKHWSNKAEKIAEKIAENFAGNFPKMPDQNKKFTPNPLCRTSGSTF